MGKAKSLNDLDATQRARVEELVGKIEGQAAANLAENQRAMTSALEEALEDDSKRAPAKSPYATLYNELPDDRIDRVIGDMSKSLGRDMDPDEDPLISCLNARSRDDQRGILAQMEHGRNAHLDKDVIGKGQDALADHYAELGKIAPFLSKPQADSTNALKMADMAQADPGDGSAGLGDWKKSSPEARLGMVKSVLTRTHGADEMADLHMGITKAKGVGGVYMPGMDSLMLSHNLMKQSYPGAAMAVAAHEYQHRRQTMNAAQKDDLAATAPGSEAHLRARLYDANLNGGYIQPLDAQNAWQSLKVMGPYIEQPVEENANFAADQYAMGTHDIETRFDLAANKAIYSAGSRLVRPMDRLISKLGNRMTASSDTQAEASNAPSVPQPDTPQRRL